MSIPTPIVPPILPIESTRPTRTNKRLSLVSTSTPLTTIESKTGELKPIIKRNGRGKAKNSSGVGGVGGGMNEDCSICAKLPYNKKKKDSNVVWVECEK